MSDYFEGQEPLAVAYEGDEPVANLYSEKAVKDCENSSWLRVERADSGGKSADE